jgi:DNA-binding MarR family transcriptional regulator
MRSVTSSTEAVEAAAWLSDTQLHDWKSVVGLLMTLPTALDAQLKRDAGINAFEYHVLVALSVAPERTLLMSELAALAQGSASRLSHAVGRLEQAGWVVRHSCSGRGRRVEAHLTDAGMRNLDDCAPGHVREVRRLVVDVLSPEQLVALGEAARAIVAAAAPDIGQQLRRDNGEPQPPCANR